MAVRKPASFTAGRKIVIGGTTYQPGDAVPNATVKGLKRLSALLSNGSIRTNIDMHNRKNRLSTPTPNSINPPMRATL